MVGRLGRKSEPNDERDRIREARERELTPDGVSGQLPAGH